MEHLTKQQIILLALLVSFVSSIATGIVTVSLMDQASPAVTQTINRVVEKTIETVTPSATTTKETIIVKEDEAITNAVAKAARSIVRIYSGSEFVAIGVMVSNTGKVAAHTIGEYTNDLSAILDGGNTVSLRFTVRDTDTGISTFQAEQSNDPKNARAYTGAAIADPDALKLGQTVVLIGGRSDTTIATGIISSKNSERVRVNILGESFDSEAILVNLLGEIVAIGDGSSRNNFIYATP